MVHRQSCEVWGQDIVWVTSWKIKLRWWHYIEWSETQNLKTINENYHFQKKTPSDLNRNLKKIKFERTFNEGKKIGKKVEIKVLVLQFNKENSMQSWIPSNLAQLWSSRRKKQIILSENQNGKQHSFVFPLTTFCQFSLHLSGYPSSVSSVDWYLFYPNLNASSASTFDSGSSDCVFSLFTSKVERLLNFISSPELSSELQAFIASFSL